MSLPLSNESTAPASVMLGAYEDQFGESRSRVNNPVSQWFVEKASTASDAYYLKVKIPGHCPTTQTKKSPVHKVIKFEDYYVAEISPDSDLRLDSKVNKAIALFTSWLNDKSEDEKKAQEEYEKIKKVLDEPRTGRKLFT